MDDSEKIVNLVDSSKVQVMSENGKYLIDVDIENLDEGKYYRVDYQGDVYGIEKLDDGQLVFYEVMD
jgi:predicted small secreted protein